MPLDPTDAGLDRIVAVELDPDCFVKARPFDELELAAFRRDVEDVHPIVMLAGTAKLHLRLKRNARALPMPWTSARVLLFHAADTPQESYAWTTGDTLCRTTILGFEME